MKLLDRTVVLVLAALVLLSSTGLFVDRMDCRKSGKEYWAFNTNLKSCSAVCETASAAVNDNCCDRFIDYFKENVVPASVKMVVLNLVSVAVTYFQVQAPVILATAKIGLLWGKAPPVPIRRHLSLSVLLI